LIKYSQNISTLLNNKTLDTSAISYILKKGDINFSESSPRQKPCGTYSVEGDYNNGDAVLMVENCDSVATITTQILIYLSLEPCVFSPTKKDC